MITAIKDQFRKSALIRIDTFCNINCQDDWSHTSISWRFAQLLTLSVTNRPLTSHFTSMWLVFLTCDWLAAFILEREIWKMTCHIGGCCCRKCQISLAGNKLFIKFQILSSKKIGCAICAHYSLVCISCVYTCPSWYQENWSQEIFTKILIVEGPAVV